MKVHSILAATDFSPRAAHAVERAALLAQKHKAGLHLLHVLPPISWTMIEKVLVEHPLITEKHLYEAARRMEALLSGLSGRPAVPVLRQGHPARVIREEAEALRADLVILGKRGRSGIEELMLGSVAESMMHRLDRDLLLLGETG